VRNHDEKIKDMVESVLPSTRRKTARTERRIIHKKQRARQRDMLRNISVEPDPDFCEGRRVSAISTMVWDRRAADNVSALVRWAGAVVERDSALAAADWPSQRAWFASVLPQDLIGQHALQHIEWAIGPRPTYSWMRRTPARPLDEIRAEVTAQVHRILESGRHAELNIRLRREYAVDRAPRWVREPNRLRPERLLAGLHDVESFVDHLLDDADLREVVADVARER
jgi:hypothetical protein